jgi:hypothetical protein
MTWWKDKKLNKFKISIFGNTGTDYVFAIPNGKKSAIEKLNYLKNTNYSDNDVVLYKKRFLTKDKKYITTESDKQGYSYWAEILTEKRKRYQSLFFKESLDFNKFVKPIKANYKTGSPYGLITPSYIMKFGTTQIYLPQDYSEFIDFLNMKQPKKVKDLSDLETEFLNKR